MNIDVKKLQLEINNTIILKNISLTLESGKCHVIMGSTGSGKSTLLKVMAGLIPADAGEIFIGEIAAHKGEQEELLRKKTGFIFQDSALWENMTVYENMCLPLRYHRSENSEKQNKSIINALVNTVGYDDKLSHRPANISVGEKKLISFIRGIIHDPQLIFMDQPTSFIDSMRKENIISIIKELKRTGKTMVIVTHNPTIASQLADSLTILHRGKVLAHGAPQEITRSDDKQVVSIIKDILDRPETWDGDILNLLE